MCARMNLEIKGVSATPRAPPSNQLSKAWDFVASPEIRASVQHVDRMEHLLYSHLKGWKKELLSSEPRPSEVPCLDLGKLGDSDDEDTYVPLSKGYPRFGPPDSSSTISWGSPLHTPQHSQRQQISKHTNQVKNQVKHVPENLPTPSDKYRLKYLQYEEEMKQSYKQYTLRCAEKKQPHTQCYPVHNTEQKDLIPTENKFSDFTPLDEKSHLQQCYTGKPYSAQQSLRKLEAEDLAAERRKQAVVEQVMIDQLSRAVISDPEQNAATTTNAITQRDLSSAPLRFRKRTLHDTMIKTSTSLTENILSNKLRFDARIICRNGRDACRELIGFFFAHDMSVTIYEYRQFGKNRTNALPFIQKGIYHHICGPRTGKPYKLDDFCTGANLTFLTTEHQALPESLKQSQILSIRITSIDEKAMNCLRDISGEKQLGCGLHWSNEGNVFWAMQDMMKEKLKSRGVQTLTGLGKFFRQVDENGDGILQKAKFKQALKVFHLDVSEEIFESFWKILDEKHEGKLDYGKFTRALIGEMNEYRKTFVQKAFMKLDPNKSGIIPMIDIRKFYCARKHPQVLSGHSSEEEILSSFLKTLQAACRNPKEVSYCEFEDFYEGLSIEILSDNDFINILRNSWGI
ncbi:calcyphosin-2 isoform X2 [Xenopus tropicalis]|uniref:Calcyphosin-2 isoform X2 n=1 Tax=Xenopus tropicalis TaxID=8364 RepID=A0A8J0SIH1_XENTR|nr:calcyphosin-2 isoform X2 [Xenopus tropicalis]